MSLIMTTRPHTGVFSFLLTIIGFRSQGLPWMPAIIAGAGFALGTLSIMTFNDFIDRHRDVEKGKALAFDFPRDVYFLWVSMSKVTFLILVAETMFSWRTAIFISAVLVAGHLYSVLKLRHPWNNLLVAVCSGSPVLAGMVYLGEWVLASLYMFAVVTSFIFMNEMVKDSQDMEGDVGYKTTFATSYGRWPTFVFVMLFVYIVLLVLALSGNWMILCAGVLLAGYQYCMGVSVTLSPYLKRAERWGGLFLATLLLMFFIA